MRFLLDCLAVLEIAVCLIGLVVIAGEVTISLLERWWLR